MIIVHGAVASTGTQAPIAYYAPQFGGGTGGVTDPTPPNDTGDGGLVVRRRRRRGR